MARRVLVYIAWGLAACACAIAFVVSGSALLLWTCAVVLVVPLAGWVLAAVGSRGLDVQLEGATSAPKGSDVECILVVRNGSHVPLPRIEVGMEIENLLTAQTCTVMSRLAVAPGETARLPVRISSDACGRVECRVTGARATEPMGIFGRNVACAATRRLSIMPDLDDVYLRNMLSASPLSDTTTYSPYKRGQDLSEVYSLRAYEPGDEIRRIHWKLSGKLDEYIVREPSLPLDNSILVFWDKSLYGAPADPLCADAMAEVVLAICERLVHEGIQFHVASNDVVEGRCMREYITDENDIYELIGHLMSSPLGEGDAGGLEQYETMFGALECSRLVYVSSGFPAEAEALSGRMDVIAFVCDGGSSLEVDGPLAQIHFGGKTADVALELAEAV